MDRVREGREKVDSVLPVGPPTTMVFSPSLGEYVRSLFFSALIPF
jgi:hypothetical protein